MDGTLGSQTARLLDGTGVEITSARGARRDRAARGARGWPVAVHAIGDRANRDALDAFEETRDEWAPLGLRRGSSTRSCSRRRTSAGSPQLGVAASVQFSHAPSDRDLAERFWGDGSTARTRTARCSTRARSSRTARRADRGARSAGRDPRRRPADARRAAAVAARSRRHVEEALEATCSRRRGSRATNAAAASSSPATSRTSSCSTATRSRPAGRAAPRSRRRDDGRRPLDAQPAAVGLVRAA